MSHAHDDAADPAAFRARRAAGQARLDALDHLGVKRFLTLDTNAYRDATAQGGLDERSKELCGLAASAVMRCDDCIAYHVERCVQLGMTKQQIVEALNVALIVGGSIVIPHLRRAVAFLDGCIEESAGAERAD